jgi:outer membrane protein TolC
LRAELRLGARRCAAPAVTCIGLLLACAPAAAQERITVPQAIDLAVAQNKELVRARLAIDSGRLNEADAATEFKTNVLPDIAYSDAGGERAVRYGVRSTTRLDWGTVVGVGLGAVTTRGASESQTRGSVRFELSQPLFRSFGPAVALEPMRLAASGSKSARRKYEQQKADLVLDVVQAYENILKLRQQVDADRESARRNDALYRITQAREGLGRTTRVDTLRAELLRGQALARLESGQERLASTQRDFAVLLGFAPDRVFDLQAAPLLELQIPPVEEAVGIALRNRLDYAQAIQDYEDASRAAELAGRRLTPDVRLTLSYDDFPALRTASGALPVSGPLLFLGVSSPTDFNLARERIAVDQAKIAEMSAAQSIELAKLSVARQVQQQLETYGKARAELKISEQNLVLATRRAKLAKALFDLGKTDNFSVADAEVAFLQAESQHFSSRADASLSGYRLSRALGKLVDAPEDLKPAPMGAAR